MAKKLTVEEQAVISASDAGYFALTAQLAEEVLVQDPGNLRILIELGHANRVLGRYEASEAALTKAVEICEPGKRDVIFGELGNLCRSQGDHDKAADFFQQQIDGDPTDATGYLYWGAMLFQLGKTRDAIEILNRGVDCQLGCLEELHFTLGLAYRSERNFGAAEKHFQKTLDFDANYQPAKIAMKDVKAAIAKT